MDALAVMTVLQERGVRIAVDDFGTGYSSLVRLCRFSVDLLKIDRSFVRNIHRDSEAFEIGHLIVIMAQALGLETCAEGMESFGERDFLKELGVRSFQGFLASPALAFDSFLSWRSGAPGNQPPSLISPPIGAGLK